MRVRALHLAPLLALLLSSLCAPHSSASPLRGPAFLSRPAAAPALRARGGDAEALPTDLPTDLPTVQLSGGGEDLTADLTVLVPPSLAKSLGLEDGGAASLLGRRRRRLPVTVRVSSKARKVTVSRNLAQALSISAGDAVKFVEGAEEAAEEAAELEFAPTLASAAQLAALSEDDVDLAGQFLVPYLASGGTLPANAIITVTSPTATGKDGEPLKCEFVCGSPVAVVVSEGVSVTVGDAVPRPSDKVGYESVGGCAKQVQQVRELVEMPLRFPQLWQSAGVPKPKGVLMHGPPGSGKTLLANALVEETGAYTVLINGPEIMSGKGGESESKLREK